MAAKKKVTKKKAKKKDTRIGAPNGIRAGRPKGAKGKATIFKEIMKEGFEAKMEKEGIKVIEAVILKAKDGDMTAAKMLLDRILPVTKAVDINAKDMKAGMGISINIEKLVADTNRKGDTIEEGEVIEDEG